jgi:CBS domain-containing protein
MNVRDVMTARPRCEAPDTPLSHVAELMETEDIGAIPILDGTGSRE